MLISSTLSKPVCHVSVFADVTFSDWAPGPGSGVVNAAVAPVWLKDTLFSRCEQEAATNGLIDSYSGAIVALEGANFTESNARYNLVSQGGRRNDYAVFFSDSPMPVGGKQDETLSLDENFADSIHLAETDSHLNQIKLVRSLL